MALTTQQKLDDARSKYHQLMTGSLRSAFVDGDTSVTFTKANAPELAKYIRELEVKLLSDKGLTTNRRRPAGAIF